MRIPFRPREGANDSGDGCVICGRAVDVKRAAYVHLLTTGELASKDEPVADDEDQGFFPIGPECAKRLPAAFRFPPEHVFGQEN